MGQIKKRRHVLMHVDGHEEPEFVVEHALGVLKAELASFVKDVVGAKPEDQKKWAGLQTSREKYLGHGISLSPEDPRALLEDIRKMRKVFSAALASRLDNDAERADRILDRLSENVGGQRSFITVCNQAMHGDEVELMEAVGALESLVALGRAIGASVEAAYLEAPLETLRYRLEWNPGRGEPAVKPMKREVTCVGIHWVQPRRVVPGAWWAVTLRRRQEVTVQADLTSDEVVKYLNDLSGPVLAGLAYCFSAPRWFVDQLGSSVTALWAWAYEVAGGDDRDKIATDLPEKFRYVSKGEDLRKPGEATAAYFRETERRVATDLGVNPASIFEIGGAGSVGALALKGMPMLADLRKKGGAIWPMDDPQLGEGLTCVEIFPRAVWTSVYPSESPQSKKNVMRRWNFIADRRDQGVVITDEQAVELAGDERAFDALLTAWALQQYGGATKWVADDVAKAEGRIWHP